MSEAPCIIMTAPSWYPRDLGVRLSHGPPLGEQRLYEEPPAEGTDLHLEGPYCAAANDTANLWLISRFLVSWERVVFTPVGTIVINVHSRARVLAALGRGFA